MSKRICKNCGECKHFNPESTFDYPPNQNVRECTGGFYKGSFVAPDAPCCPDFEPKQTVFHQITASPEVLAEKLVYCTMTEYYKPFSSTKCGMGLVLSEEWRSTVNGRTYKTKSEAIAATVEKLKGVAE